jgi:hypothetical protein
MNGDGTLTLSNSTVSGNSATYWGGGIYNSGTTNLSAATLAITNSTLSGNSASDGGGIVKRCGRDGDDDQQHLSGNSAVGPYPGDGGGIWNTQTLTMIKQHS